jgi:uncharacterized membrane protein YqgA involved in biofilm formation
VVLLGTLINTAAVIAGSLVGLFLHARLPKRLTTVAFQAIGLFTLFMGVSMAMKTTSFLVMVFSIVPGAIAGELIDIDRHLKRLGEWLKSRVRSGNERFTEGMVAAFLLFCMGSMTVLGAIEEGMGSKPNLLVAKSVLDGFASVALAASLGVGVLFSAVPLLVYQGGLTIFAGSLHSALSNVVVNEISAVGGLILVGLGINILEIRQLKVINMLPALAFAGVLAAVFLR